MKNKKLMSLVMAGIIGLGSFGVYSNMVNADSEIEFKTYSSIDGGSDHTLVISQDGEAYAFGGNKSGQLGDGTTENRNTPVKVEGLENKNLVSVSTGRGSWGTNGHSLALTDTGEVYAWGDNEYGQLGDGTTTNRLTPVKVRGLIEGKNIVSINAGSFRSFVLTDTGEVYAWGYNTHGTLGDGTKKNRHSPVKIQGIEGKNIVSMDTRGNHALVLTDTGEVYAWGNGGHGQLGYGNNYNRLTPIKVIGLAGENIVSVSAGGGHSLAVTDTGEVYSWGHNNFGQLGLGDTGYETNRHRPVKVTGLAGKNIVSVSAGTLHSLAVTDTGEVYSWGRNGDGKLGIGTLAGRYTPGRVIELVDKKVISVTAGEKHSIALTDTGEVYVWGRNGTGRLGLGDSERRIIPTLLGGFQAQVPPHIEIPQKDISIDETGTIYTFLNPSKNSTYDSQLEIQMVTGIDADMIESVDIDYLVGGDRNLIAKDVLIENLNPTIVDYNGKQVVQYSYTWELPNEDLENVSISITPNYK